MSMFHRENEFSKKIYRSDGGTQWPTRKALRKVYRLRVLHRSSTALRRLRSASTGPVPSPSGSDAAGLSGTQIAQARRSTLEVRSESWASDRVCATLRRSSVCDGAGPCHEQRPCHRDWSATAVYYTPVFPIKSALALAARARGRPASRCQQGPAPTTSAPAAPGLATSAPGLAGD